MFGWIQQTKEPLNKQMVVNSSYRSCDSLQNVGFAQSEIFVMVGFGVCRCIVECKYASCLRPAGLEKDTRLEWLSGGIQARMCLMECTIQEGNITT